MCKWFYSWGGLGRRGDLCGLVVRLVVIGLSSVGLLVVKTCFNSSAMELLPFEKNSVEFFLFQVNCFHFTINVAMMFDIASCDSKYGGFFLPVSKICR